MYRSIWVLTVIEEKVACPVDKLADANLAGLN